MPLLHIWFVSTCALDRKEQLYLQLYGGREGHFGKKFLKINISSLLTEKTKKKNRKK